jgi:Multiubiquitin
MNEHKKDYEFFVDGKRFESEQPHLTGAEIKAKAGAPANYQLFLEEEGDKPDRPIPDTETVDLQGKIKHFFAVPPATFGVFE